MIELRRAGLQAKSQKAVAVRYEDGVVGEFVADIVVEHTVIVELKSVGRIEAAHEVQLVNCLVATGKPVGLLLNFGRRKVDVKRKLKELNPR